MHVFDGKGDVLPVDTKNPSNNKDTYFSKFTTRRRGNLLSVASKLNIVNVLVVISGILSIIGAYEIQMGGKMHELNYLHQKYITEVVKSVKVFETDRAALIAVEDNIVLARQQPIDCLALIGPIEELMMALMQTDHAIRLCQNDVLVADNTLQKIRDYRLDKISKDALLTNLYQSIETFESNGTQFEPLVGRTVRIIFFIVISIVIAKAFIVPIFGFLLSHSVARDYRILSDTKISLEKEKKYSALIQSEKMASLTTLVAGIAHEINTPLGVSITANSHSNEMLNRIKASYKAESLTEDELCLFFAEIEKVNDIISSNLLRTSELIKSFKMVSTEQVIEELQSIELKPYIEQVLITLSPLTQRSNLTIEFTCDEGLQGHLYGDALIQIITNIVTNAIDHAFEENQHGILSISATKTTENKIHLSFKDNGRGISEGDQLHIFEPFFTTARKNGNTGLGLHILHNLVVEKLKGSVSCSSKIDQGTRFDIHLPINCGS